MPWNVMPHFSNYSNRSTNFVTDKLNMICPLCLNSLKGLLLIRFMVTWFVITYTQLCSLLIEEITALKQHF